jgi:hypothetical protein
MRKTILLLCSLMSLTAAAQQPVVDTEFVTIALDEAVDGFFYFDGVAAQPFQANITGISQPQRYKGPQRFALRENAAEFSATPPLPKPAASVLLPLNCRRVLITCVKSGDKPLRMVAYDISTNNRAGDYRFFNFSKQTLSLILGEKRFALPPGKDTSVSDSAWRGAVLDIPIQCAAVQNNKPKLVYSSIWGHRPGRRNFIFMFDGSHPTKPVNFCRFFDIPPTAKPAGS